MNRSITLLAALISISGLGIWPGLAIAQQISPAPESPSLDGVEPIPSEAGSSADLMTEPADASSMPLVPVRDPAIVEPVNPALTRDRYVSRDPIEAEPIGEPGPAQANRVQFLLE